MLTQGIPAGYNFPSPGSSAAGKLADRSVAGGIIDEPPLDMDS
jgi:hypothetical protein